MEINIFKKKSSSEFMLTNKERILTAPTNEPNNNLITLVFLFKIKETLNNNIKSKKKLSKTIKSTYIFILSPRYKYKKRHINIVSS